jgi:hypothetical protein
MMDDWGTLLFMLGLYFFVPILLSKVLGASWRRILIAYGIWIALLGVFGLTNARTLDEAIGWPLILGMFMTIPAIPVIALVLRLARVK